MRVRVVVQTRGAAAWVSVVGRLGWLLGPALTKRLARAGAARLVRYRIEDGPWRPLESSAWDMILAHEEG